MLPGCAGLDWIKNKLSGKDNTKNISLKELEKDLMHVPTDEEACPLKNNKEEVKEIEAKDSEVLATMNGKPIITKAMFEAEFDKLLEKNPQVKALLSLMPDLEEKFVENMVNQKITDYYITDHKIDQSAAYQETLDGMVKELKQALNAEFFARQFTVNVSDAEVLKYYEENKTEIPELIVSYGGTNAMGVSFDNQADAQAFFEKVKNASQQFERIAKESGLNEKFRDFKLVNAHSVGLDPAIRAKVITIKTFPTIEIVQGNDKKYWVVNAMAQEEAKYQPFDKVKDLIKPVVEREKQLYRLQDEYKKLMQEYNIKINKEYFEKKQGEQKKSDIMEQFMQQSPEAQESVEGKKKAPTARVA